MTALLPVANDLREGLPADLQAAAITVLDTGDAAAKAKAALAVAAAYAEGRLVWPTARPVMPPDRPARPPRPELIPASRMKRRGTGSVAGRIALLHALAHIELNAIDLAFDLVARFACDGSRPEALAAEWVVIGAEEGRHFLMLAERLAVLGAAYGDLPAHDGLWEAAAMTAHDLAARLAVVPLVLEARGLDVTQGMIDGLARAGDTASAAVVAQIQAEEVGHVACGLAWLRRLCAETGEDFASAWLRLVRAHFKGQIKPPFNEALRRAAGFLPAEYEALSAMAVASSPP